MRITADEDLLQVPVTLLVPILCSCGGSHPTTLFTVSVPVAVRASLVQDAIPLECRSLSLDSLIILDISCFLLLIVNGGNAGNSYDTFVQFADNSCAGVLIAEDIVLTSGSCLNGGAPSTVYVSARQRCCDGTDADGYEHEVECAYRHEDYEEGSVKNDIALIKLKRRCPIETARLGNNNECDYVDGNRDYWAVGLVSRRAPFIKHG